MINFTVLGYEILALSIFCAVMSTVAVMLCLPRNRRLLHKMALMVMLGALFFIGWWGLFSWPFGFN